MFVSPSAMPSRLARLRWVTRESASTASSSFKSRCASMSMGADPAWCEVHAIGFLRASESLGDEVCDADARPAVAERADGARHRVARGDVRQELAGRGGNGMGIRSDEPRNAVLDRLGPLGPV